MPAISAAPLRPAPIKGNSGETARRRTQQKFATLLIGVLLLWVTIQTIWRSYFAGIFVPDIEIDAFGNTKIRRRPQRHTKKYQPEQSTYVPFVLFLPESGRRAGTGTLASLFDDCSCVCVCVMCVSYCLLSFLPLFFLAV